MREHHITVARTARYYTMGPEAGRVEHVWFVCHGYGQLAGRFLRRFAALDDGHTLIVAPEALCRHYLEQEPGPHGPESRVGATWMTREDRLAEISDYVAYLDNLYDHVFRSVDRAAATVHVLGFSQGAAAVARWIAMGRAAADHLVLWGAGPPPDLDLEVAAPRFAGLRLELVVGEHDPFATPDAAARDEERLRRHGIPCHLVTFPGPHEVEPGVLRVIAQPR